MSNFTLHVLGTASALPTVNRYPSAYVLDVRGRLLLFDCGEGAQMQMRRMGISFLKIDCICISHIHGDHLFGLFGLLSTMVMLGRKTVLHLFAPSSFAPVMQFFMDNFGERNSFGIDLHLLSMDGPEEIFLSKYFTISAFPLNHRIETYGYLVRELEPGPNVRKECIGQFGLSLAEIATLKRGEDVVREDGSVIPAAEATYIPYEPRSFAYCSDTAPFPELSSWVRGVDLLYHEATFPVEMKEMAQATFHSTTADAARCAKEAGVGRLLVGHYSSRYPDVGIFLDELRPVFPESCLASELESYDVPLKSRKG